MPEHPYSLVLVIPNNFVGSHWGMGTSTIYFSESLVRWKFYLLIIATHTRSFFVRMRISARNSQLNSRCPTLIETEVRFSFHWERKDYFRSDLWCWFWVIFFSFLPFSLNKRFRVRETNGIDFIQVDLPGRSESFECPFMEIVLTSCPWAKNSMPHKSGHWEGWPLSRGGHLEKFCCILYIPTTVVTLQKMIFLILNSENEEVRLYKHEYELKWKLAYWKLYMRNTHTFLTFIK